MPTKMLAAACAMAAMMLAGCYSTGEPGGYMGARDPLLSKHARPEQKEALKQRLAMVEDER